MFGLTSQTFASDYLITFFVQTNGSASSLAGYGRTFTGTVSVRDEAVTPNAIAMFNTPDITDFHVDVVGPKTTYEYRLADDIFAPDPKFSKGLRFDENSHPLYFETPGFFVCSPCGEFYDTVDVQHGALHELEFISSFSTFKKDLVVGQDGNFYRRIYLPEGQTTLYDVAGGWKFDAFNGSGDRMQGIYTVTAIPEPETYVMFLLGFGLMGFAVRWQKVT
jgi:hypothetical protein